MFIAAELTRSGWQLVMFDSREERDVWVADCWLFREVID